MCKRGGAFSLVEVLVAVTIFSLIAVALSGMLSSGRRSTEFNARYVEAAFLARKVLDMVCRDALWKFDSLASDAKPLPLLALNGGTISPWFERLPLNEKAVKKLYPNLNRHLENFRVQTVIAPFETRLDVKNVQVVVEYRLSPAETRWHRMVYETLVARRTAF